MIIASLLPPLLINIFFALKHLYKHTIKKSNLTYIKLGWHLSITNSIHFLPKSIDKIFIGLMLPFENLAVYSFAILVPDQLNSLTKQIIPLFFPKISKLTLKDFKYTFLKKFILAELLILIIIVLYFLLSPFIFMTFFRSYQDSILLSQIYALSLLSLPSVLFGIIYQRFKIHNYLYIQELIPTTIMIILSIILIAPLGILGIIISQVISRFIFILISLILFHFYRNKI